MKRKILEEKRKHRDFCRELEQYRDIFDLESDQEKNFLKKIRETRDNLKKDSIYKI